MLKFIEGKIKSKENNKHSPPGFPPSSQTFGAFNKDPTVGSST